MSMRAFIGIERRKRISPPRKRMYGRCASAALASGGICGLPSPICMTSPSRVTRMAETFRSSAGGGNSLGTRMTISLPVSCTAGVETGRRSASSICAAPISAPASWPCTLTTLGRNTMVCASRSTSGPRSSIGTQAPRRRISARMSSVPSSSVKLKRRRGGSLPGPRAKTTVLNSAAMLSALTRTVPLTGCSVYDDTSSSQTGSPGWRGTMRSASWSTRKPTPPSKRKSTWCR